MQQTPELLERTLCKAYRQQESLYAQALELAEPLPAALETGAGSDEPLKQIVALLNQVAAVEDEISETKRCWQNSACSPSPELRATLARVSHLIQQLTDIMQISEVRADQFQHNLLPDLDEAARGRRMQRAYERWS